MGGYAEQRGCELRGGCGDGAAVFSLGNSRHKFLHYGDSRAHPSYRRPSLFPSSGRGAEHSSAAAGRYRPIAIDDYRRLDPPRVRSFAATSTIALGKHGRALLQPSDRVSLSLSLFSALPPPPSPSPRATPLCLPVGETVSHRAAGERETLFSRKLSNAVRPRQSNQQLWKYAMGLETMVIINAGRLRRAMEHAHRCIDISWMIIAQTIMIISFQSSRGN